MKSVSRRHEIILIAEFDGLRNNVGKFGDVENDD
jgi:hypothetical protein